MEEEYKKYCVDAIKNMLEDGNGGNIGQIYRFLIHNSKFIEDNEKFRTASIDKAKNIIPEVIKKIEDTEGIKKTKFINMKKILEEFLEKYNKIS